MQQIFRWLVRVLVAGGVLAVLALAGVYYFAARSLPDYEATHRVAGLAAPVEIVRDNAGVPHIFGQNDADVFFGLGYAHAQDRLWQMNVLRRTVQGTLSEVFGPATLKSDELMRRLDLYGAAQAALAAQDAQTRAALEAYARGVNARIRAVNDQALGRGAPEFFLYANTLAYWSPADSLALLKLFGARNTGALAAEVLRARLSLVLPGERVGDLMPEAPGTGLVELPDYAALAPGLAPASAPQRSAALPFGPDPRAALPAPAFAPASNAWAAAPERAAAGGALLANDPHGALSAPSAFYLARLDLGSGAVIGATLPGVPLVLAGRSARLGWGITAAHADDMDLFLEQLDPARPEHYLTPGGSARFETRRSIITVREAAPLTLTLRFSDNGPVLPGSHFGLAEITPPDHVMALGWTLLSHEDGSMSGLMGVMRAGAIAPALEAAAQISAPVLNLVLADAETVALQTVGALPLRDGAHQSQGRLPAPGWRAENRWQGLLPRADLPKSLAPEGGIVGNTNNRLPAGPFPRHLGFDWGDTQRVERWRHLMQSREVHTRESFIEAQLDTVSFTARSLLPLIGRDLWFEGPAAPAGTPERRRQEALALLAAWNGDMNEHMPEPLIYAAWMRALQDGLIRDELGPLADAFSHVEPLFIERVFRDAGGAGAWCDVVQSRAVESCTEIARAALDTALQWIAEHEGGALEALQWGAAHEARHDHPQLGRWPLLSWLVNLRQPSSGGDNTLMRGLSAGTPEAPFANVHAALYRGVYDFADPESSVYILSTGQSGHPLSRHYDDLGERWRRGEYIPMSLDPALARAAAVGITRLRPTPDE